MFILISSKARGDAGQGPLVLQRHRAGNPFLKPHRKSPPPQPPQMVGGRRHLEAGIEDNAVVDEPESGGDEVGDDYIDGVVASGHHQHDHSGRGCNPCCAVEGVESARSVLGEDEIAEDEDHGVAGEDEVTAVDVLAVYGESEPRYDLDHPVQNLHEGDCVVELGRALVEFVGRGEHSDDHGDGTVAVEEADDHADATNQNQSVLVENDDDSRHCCGHHYENF